MKLTIDDININQWYMDRELKYVPKHFVLTTATHTNDSRNWILEKLTGRFCTSWKYVAFEDPKEALFYQLVWG